MAAKVTAEISASRAHPSGLGASAVRRLKLAALACCLCVCACVAVADQQSDAFTEAMKPLEPLPRVIAPDQPTEQTPPDKPVTTSPEMPQEKPPPTPPVETKPEAVTPTQPVGELPEPSPDSELISLRADDLYYTSDGGTQASGNAGFGYQEYRGTADILEIDSERVWINLRGDVHVQDPDMFTTAERFELNLDTEYWHAFNTRTRVEPSFFDQGVVEPLYLDGRTVHGQPDIITLRHGRGSSCDREDKPHWCLKTDRIKVLPDVSVRFHKPTLYLYGRRLFRYPWDLRLSMRKHSNRFIPEFGENEVEGYFLKFAYLYLLNEANSGVLRLHTTQKRGIGLGVDHDFDFGTNYGSLILFAEPSQGSFSGRFSDAHQFSDGFSADLSSNIQRYTGYGYGSTSLSNNLTFRNRSTKGNTLLGIQHSLMESDYSTNRRMTVNVNQRYQPSEDYSWEVRSVMQRNAYRADEAADEELNSELRFRGRERSYDWEAIAKKRHDLDGSAYTGDDNSYSLDQLPELMMSTDSSRLDDWRLLGRARVRAQLNLGRFQQQPDNTSLSRAALDISLPGHSKDIGAHMSLHNSLQFRQQFSSEGSAQWYANFRSQLSGQIGNSWDYRLSGYYGSPHGYSPLRLGYSGRSQSVSFQAVHAVEDKRRIDISTGFDFTSDYWRDLSIRSQFMLAPSSRLELQTGYSLERSEWRPITVRWLRATSDWYSAITSYYDLDRSKLTRATGEINWRINRFWHLDMLAGYSGYTHRLDQLEFHLLRDLHCMMASLSYNKELSEFRVNLGIKAFPSNERVFGYGSGSRFESNFGEYY
jgi:hypothetical protein